MPAKKGNHRGRGTFPPAGSLDREASLDSVRRSMIASPDEERSLTEHEDNAEEAEEQNEEQNFSSPQLEERQMNQMTADLIQAPSTPLNNERGAVLKASEEQEHQRPLVSSRPTGTMPMRVYHEEDVDTMPKTNQLDPKVYLFCKTMNRSMKEKAITQIY
eukprot:767009-Hanusia_phi.AAC.11